VRASCNKGFSLLEAIVALVVLSLVFTSVWQWFGTASQSTQRIEQAIALPGVLSQMSVLLDMEPLDVNRQGVFLINGFAVSWEAIPIQSSDDFELRKQPAWIVTLFAVNVSISKKQKVVSTFTTKAIRQYPDPSYVDLSGDI
jgi:prepilin-type N-terminal cleavage/methylation domain-containing protein